MVPGLTPLVRTALRADLPSIRAIYNEGIEDRIATLDADPKTDADLERWFADHGGRYAVLVAEIAGSIVGWASLNRYSPRTAYDGVADLSIYVVRQWRGKGVGKALMTGIEVEARRNAFHKIVLFMLDFNELGRGLYRRSGFQDVGVFRQQGKVEGRFVDVLAMEKVF